MHSILPDTGRARWGRSAIRPEASRDIPSATDLFKRLFFLPLQVLLSLLTMLPSLHSYATPAFSALR